MRRMKLKPAAVLALAAGVAVFTPVAANALAISVFGQLRLGAWEIRERGEDRARRVCLRSERDLVQLRHRGQSCRRIVVEDNATDATVQYSCGGSGYGRTYIRRESPDLVQLRTDGIEGGAPFSFEAEGRRVGNCS